MYCSRSCCSQYRYLKVLLEKRERDDITGVVDGVNLCRALLIL
jgi:hypothetical protein